MKYLSDSKIFVSWSNFSYSQTLAIVSIQLTFSVPLNDSRLFLIELKRSQF